MRERILPAVVPVPTPPHDRRASRRPVRLEIPAARVSAPVIRLGLAPDRTVQVPTDADQAGWFTAGPPPGAIGSAVILGHVDSLAGPAVFAHLRDLTRGDSLQVVRADGSRVRFEVLRLALYLNRDFPAEQVYTSHHARRLNLVTCGGAYDAGRGGYQSNLVVYTRRTA